MKVEDKKRFLSCLVATSEYYGKPMSDAVIGLWWEGLKAYDIAAIEHAFASHVKNPDTGQFMPKIADVVKMIGGTTNDRSLVAWAKVDKAVRQVGPYETVVFDDPLINRVLHDMGGWMILAEKTDDDWPFVAKEFEQRYRGYAMRDEIPEYPSKLIGMFEATNNKNGHKYDGPIVIGDFSKALRVLGNGSPDQKKLFVRVDSATLSSERIKIAVEKDAA